jgi:hypothetical protein
MRSNDMTSTPTHDEPATGEMTVAVKDLRIGDAVDLEGDPYADPNQENPALECEYQQVYSVERETGDCVAVGFDGFDIVGFPPDHLVTVRLPRPEPGLDPEQAIMPTLR